MTQLTNKYKEWIIRQIHVGCPGQAENEHYVSKLRSSKTSSRN